MKDQIDRQAAIDTLGEEPLIWDDESEWKIACRTQREADINAIQSVPSSQLSSALSELVKGIGDFVKLEKNDDGDEFLKGCVFAFFSSR